MTILVGDIKDVGLSPTEGTVTVFSARTRRANNAGGVITRERRDYVLSAGRFRTGELDPGRTTVELVAPGVFESWTFDLPADGTVSLVDAVELSVDYAPDSAVVNGAAAAAAKAERWAGEAAGSAAVASRARDEAVSAQASVSRVVESAVTVVRGEFTDLTGRAESAADRAVSARDAAESSAGAAASSAESAAASATTAGGHVSAVQGSAERAEQARDAAEGHAMSAESHAEAAAGSASAAEHSAGAARDAVGAVNDAASRAQAARVGSEQARDEAVQAAESAKTGAPVGGWDVSSLSQGVRESLGRADSAITVVPTATASSAGGVKLAGDLAGTWDAPTVPGLKDKADATALGGLVKRLELLETLRDVLVLTPDTQAVTQLRAELTRRGLDYQTVEKIPFSIDARNAKDKSLDGLFASCAKLREGPLVFNTSSITKMRLMFAECSSLASAPEMDTNSVTAMSSMFRNCAALTTAPALNTRNVTTMEAMFEGCVNLTYVPDLDSRNVSSVRSMFMGCGKLRNGNVRLISKKAGVDTGSFLFQSGLTREPFFTPDGQPIN
ncbi:DUF285 domain-containing protein [Corynebacterium amycolatum]|uniref:DUF285 domain-containing protein n=1 Tax=Corynebacterium amycolatum TaxID=43765 RepID=UPI001CCA6529|nr:DUF285 domain-containing protein [Corynebacterium amycolatum]MCA0444366.1 DUF285 domain-containing protein [Corynebacterium amycolatum]